MSPVRHSSSHHHDTSDGRKESGARYRRSRSPRLNEPSKVSRVQRVSDRLSPLRKKAPPVNELDIVSLEKKNEEKSRTGTSSAVRTEIFRTGIGDRRPFARTFSRRPGRFDGRGAFPMVGEGGFGGRQGRDYRRIPAPAFRRGFGKRDVGDSNATAGRLQRTREREERSVTKPDPNKPVMNLFDPTIVPTGRSYYTHDDRTSRPMRSNFRSRPYDSFDDSRRGRPLGWRNAPRARDDDRDNYSDRSPRRNDDRNHRLFEPKPSDGMWKHDLFEEINEDPDTLVVRS